MEWTELKLCLSLVCAATVYYESFRKSHIGDKHGPLGMPNRRT